MKKYIIDEKTRLKYELVGDYYYPCLEAPDAPKVGRFGIIYHNYLRDHKRVTYSGLMLSGKLKEHIKDIDRQAEDMFSQLVDRMKQDEGVTEHLKAADRNPYSWNMEFLPYPDGSGYEARFTACGICTLMRELGLADLVPALCRLDYSMSEAGGTSEFVREYTLASGGAYCDCGYKKK